MDKIEQKILNTIDAHREEIIKIGRDIWEHAECGYKEVRTSRLFQDHMKKLGLSVENGLAITGAKAYLKGSKKEPVTVALVGELDALPIPDSPFANPETGAAHCCGHNAQMAALMGSAFALCDPEIKEALDGEVVFFAVPAEEFVEIEFKNQLMKDGKIRYGGGKSELIRIGAFDDIDVAVGHHATMDADIQVINNTNNGFLNKIVHFYGVSSHAADAPYKGVDALNAATLAIQAINMQQESYRDQDSVRVHGFISRGGTAMNIIADHTTLEYSVRANNIRAIENANEKFDRAVKAGAMASGCGIDIFTMPGYLPTVPVDDLRAVNEAISIFTDKYNVKMMDPDLKQGGSTDFGDLSSLKPLLQFYTGGYTGVLHDKNMHPADVDIAYVLPAKIFALTAYNLLKEKARYAKELKENFKPVMTKEAYINYMEAHILTESIPAAPLKFPLDQ